MIAEIRNAVLRYTHDDLSSIAAVKKAIENIVNSTGNEPLLKEQIIKDYQSLVQCALLLQSKLSTASSTTNLELVVDFINLVSFIAQLNTSRFVTSWTIFLSDSLHVDKAVEKLCIQTAASYTSPSEVSESTVASNTSNPSELSSLSWNSLLFKVFATSLNLSHRAQSIESFCSIFRDVNFNYWFLNLTTQASTTAATKTETLAYSSSTTYNNIILKEDFVKSTNTKIPVGIIGSRVQKPRPTHPSQLLGTKIANIVMKLLRLNTLSLVRLLRSWTTSTAILRQRCLNSAVSHITSQHLPSSEQIQAESRVIKAHMTLAVVLISQLPLEILPETINSKIGDSHSPCTLLEIRQLVSLTIRCMLEASILLYPSNFTVPSSYSTISPAKKDALYYNRSYTNQFSTSVNSTSKNQPSHNVDITGNTLVACAREIQLEAMKVLMEISESRGPLSACQDALELAYSLPYLSTAAPPSAVQSFDASGSWRQRSTPSTAYSRAPTSRNSSINSSSGPVDLSVATITSTAQPYLNVLLKLCEVVVVDRNPSNTHISPVITRSRQLFLSLLQLYFCYFNHQNPSTFSTWIQHEVLPPCLDTQDTVAKVFGFKIIGIMLQILESEMEYGLKPSSYMSNMFCLEEHARLLIQGCRHADHQVRSVAISNIGIFSSKSWVYFANVSVGEGKNLRPLLLSLVLDLCQRDKIGTTREVAFRVLGQIVLKGAIPTPTLTRIQSSLADHGNAEKIIDCGGNDISYNSYITENESTTAFRAVSEGLSDAKITIRQQSAFALGCVLEKFSTLRALNRLTTPSHSLEVTANSPHTFLPPHILMEIVQRQYTKASEPVPGAVCTQSDYASAPWLHDAVWLSFCRLCCKQLEGKGSEKILASVARCLGFLGSGLGLELAVDHSYEENIRSRDNQHMLLEIISALLSKLLSPKLVAQIDLGVTNATVVSVSNSVHIAPDAESTAAFDPSKDLVNAEVVSNAYANHPKKVVYSICHAVCLMSRDFMTFMKSSSGYQPTGPSQLLNSSSFMPVALGEQEMYSRARVVYLNMIVTLASLLRHDVLKVKLQSCRGLTLLMGSSPADFGTDIEENFGGHFNAREFESYRNALLRALENCIVVVTTLGTHKYTYAPRAHHINLLQLKDVKYSVGKNMQETESEVRKRTGTGSELELGSGSEVGLWPRIGLGSGSRARTGSGTETIKTKTFTTSNEHTRGELLQKSITKLLLLLLTNVSAKCSNTINSSEASSYTKSPNPRIEFRSKVLEIITYHAEDLVTFLEFYSRLQRQLTPGVVDQSLQDDQDLIPTICESILELFQSDNNLDSGLNNWPKSSIRTENQVSSHLSTDVLSRLGISQQQRQAQSYFAFSTLDQRDISVSTSVITTLGDANASVCCEYPLRVENGNSSTRTGSLLSQLSTKISARLYALTQTNLKRVYRTLQMSDMVCGWTVSSQISRGESEVEMNSDPHNVGTAISRSTVKLENGYEDEM